MSLRRAVILMLAVCMGGWQLGECCNTQAEECRQMMDNAMEMPTAQQKCSGMQAYLKCVQDDIADCTGNKFSDLYARNMVSAYCNQAFICSDSLQRCYKNLTQDTMRKIAQSDNATRIQLCRSVVKPIMECQESVMSRCHNQTGLMETVSSHQATLKTVCSDADPCLDMVLKCQSSIMDITPGNGQSATLQYYNTSANCSDHTTLDYCGAYRTALACVRANVTVCADRYKVDNIIATLHNTTASMCDPGVTCMQKVSSCLCHISKQSSYSPMAIITTICSTYPPFNSCLSNLGQECYASDDVMAEVTSLRASYQHYHKLYCTKEGGLCPEALQCLINLPQTSALSSSPRSVETFPLAIDKLCLSAGPLFGCLETASTRCENEASDVTFPKIEDNLLAMCLEIGPHLEKLHACDSYMRCMKELPIVGLTLSVYSNSTQLADVSRRMFAGLTKTDFWCSYLNHGFQCVADSAVSCSLGTQFAVLSRQKYMDIKATCQGPTTPAPATTESPGGGIRPSKEGDGNPNRGASACQPCVLQTVLSAVTALWFVYIVLHTCH